MRPPDLADGVALARASRWTTESVDTARKGVAGDLVSHLRRAPLPPRLDDICRETANLYNVQTCLVSLLDDREQTFVVRHGISVTTAKRAKSPDFQIGQVPCERELPTIVLDAASDRRFTDDELVRQGEARLYVGAPIIVRHGMARIFIGTLCLLDPTPREAFNLSEAAALLTRAEEVASLLESALLESSVHACTRSQQMPTPVFVRAQPSTDENARQNAPE